MLKKSQIIATLILFVVLMTAFGFFAKVEYKRCTNLKDAGLVELYRNGMHTSPGINRNGRSNSKNYVDFIFYVDKKQYSVSLSTSSLNYEENSNLFGLNPTNIERYVLYSDGFSIASREHVSLESYRQKEMLNYSFALIFILALVIVPSFIYRFMNTRLKPKYKNNKHTSDEVSLVGWPLSTYGNVFFIWFMVIVWLFPAYQMYLNVDFSAGTGEIYIFIGLLVTSIIFMAIYVFLPKEFVAIYEDEIVQKIQTNISCYSHKDILSYQKLESKRGKYLGYVFFTSQGKFMVWEEHFHGKNLENFLRETKYII